ncbi:uncharacterized protein LOC122505893 [Leptopilina heterotoma]|uniref:uncharacterized protein LOC122505893 n=1 Tax=Leptopilina heterotoma TaxID=63436 RepID=UPI001CA9CFA7|nr:uncharacterized protein LOC122505893 [Leptopilina heterotoma]
MPWKNLYATSRKQEGDTSQEDANKLEKVGHVKIGFVSCKIRKKVMVTRCHRCLDYGHIGRNCQTVDKSAACFKCGEAGHKVADCRKSPCCFLCKAKCGDIADIKHVAGSCRCGVFRSALEEAKKTLVRTRNKEASTRAARKRCVSD